MGNNLRKPKSTGNTGEHNNVNVFLFYLTEKGNVPFQGNLGLKISRFSCMIHPIENAFNSVINGPTFTKFGSYIANFVYFEN